MAILQAQDIDDVVASTLRNLNKGRLHQVAQALQRYEIMSRWLRKDKIVVDGGYGIQENLITKVNTNAADHIGLFEEVQTNQTDILATIKVDWVHAQTWWTYDIVQQMMNASSSKIVDMVKSQEVSAMIRLADKLEAASWSLPAAGNSKFPWSIPYYVVYDSTTGFNGGAPTGFTTVANIDPAVHTTYKNYTAQYTNATKDDLIYKMRLAFMKVGFESPMPDEPGTVKSTARYRIYLDAVTKLALEDAATAQNDRLGFNLDPASGKTTFHGINLIWVPYFDDNMASGSNPVYMIDRDSFYTAVLRGNFFRTDGPNRAAHQPNVREIFRNISYQHICVNRRSQALLAKSDPAA